MLKYDKFIEKINEAGFRTRYSNYLDAGTFGHGNRDPHGKTEDPKTYPSRWCYVAAYEKKLAYGYFFNGNPYGFIAPRFYSIFIDAFRPRMTMEERYKAGKLSKYEWMVWNVFAERKEPISWSDIWQHYKIKDAVERRNLDSALKNLQMTFDLTVGYDSQKPLIHDKTTYYKDGSPVMGLMYDKVDNWVPAEWLKMNKRMTHEEALETIYRQAEITSTPGDAKKAFNKSLKLYKSFC